MYLPIAIIAYLLNGIAVSVDKFLLAKVIPNPLIYIFYLSLLSFFALFALPFTKIPSTEVILLSSISTVLWTMGAYFLFQSLKVGQVQRVIPIIGTLNPIILFVIGIFSSSFTDNQVWAIVFLVLGIIFLTLPDWQGKITKSELVFEVLSASFFAFSYLILKEAYAKESFITVLVWGRFVLIPVALALLVIPKLRGIIWPKKELGASMIKKGGLAFVGGQICAGISQFMIFFAISLGHPAIVNSLQGVQYVFLFVLALVLSKKYPTVFNEKYSLPSFSSKVVGITLIGIGLYVLTL